MYADELSPEPGATAFSLWDYGLALPRRGARRPSDCLLYRWRRDIEWRSVVAFRPATGWHAPHAMRRFDLLQRFPSHSTPHGRIGQAELHTMTNKRDAFVLGQMMREPFLLRSREIGERRVGRFVL